MVGEKAHFYEGDKQIGEAWGAIAGGSPQIVGRFSNIDKFYISRPGSTGGDMTPAPVIAAANDCVLYKGTDADAKLYIPRDSILSFNLPYYNIVFAKNKFTTELSDTIPVQYKASLRSNPDINEIVIEETTAKGITNGEYKKKFNDDTFQIDKRKVVSAEGSFCETICPLLAGETEGFSEGVSLRLFSPLPTEKQFLSAFEELKKEGGKNQFPGYS
ncbi:unnamed protein product [marine sediment metagenome]|uniref:Uncharacterized protein n=1 Tax=marine sediment metagenome TaxID=412755 RepID=X1EZL8_9ZZZZ